MLLNEMRRGKHHARPCLDLLLPVAQGREGRNDQEGAAVAQQLPLELQNRYALRRLTQAHLHMHIQAVFRTCIEHDLFMI